MKIFRGVAQPGSALRSGRRGRRFESYHPDMAFYFYILFSKSQNRYYVGHTNNLDRRLSEHNSRQTSSTKAGIPWELVFTKQFDNNIEANRFELHVKKMKSRKFIESLILSG